MDEVVSPTVARRRVRLALREAREAADLTQLEVAEEMEWSLSKVIRIENGDVSIAPNDLKPLLAFLGVKDRARVNALVADARISRTRQHVSWWQQPVFRELSDPLRRYIEYEAVATEIRSFYIRYFPGPLQLPEYAAALTGPFVEEMPATKVDAVIEARRLRREALLSRLGSMSYFIVLDEAVFQRSTGGPVVFVKQLRELVRLAENRFARIRMLPFSLDMPIANNASFDVLSLGRGAMNNDVLYRENGMADELIDDRATTSRHLNRFNQLWQVSTDEADTIAYVGRRIAQLEATIASSQGKSDQH
jgi:transcriptional regulator with XRE-family HTH domain